MNKRGFIKTLEAVLAVMIVFIFMFTVRQTGGETSLVDSMRDIQEGLLAGVSQDDVFRNCIVISQDFVFSGDGGNNPCLNKDLKSYIDNSLPSRFKDRYIVQSCDANNCNLPPEVTGSGEKNLYTSAVIISSDLETYNPKIFRIWMW